MKKFKYLIKRFFSMDFKQMFDVIDELHKKTHKSKLLLLIDILVCGIKYQAGYMDYKLFEMYNLNKSQRKTIITRGINNEIIKKYNDKEYIHYFSSKIEFNKRFNKYLLRDWMELTNDNYEEFKTFTERHSRIIVKPISESCGKGVEMIKVSKQNCKRVFEELLASNRILVEEVGEQHSDLKRLHPTSINTIRIVTLNKKIVAAFLRIGNDNNVVDNFNHGGMVAPINISTGIIDYLAIDKKGNLYEKHPLTKENILWFKVPKWPRIKRFVERATEEVPEVGYVGWDVSLYKDPYLIEANEFPGHDLYQLPPHRSDGIGLLPQFKEAMKENEK